MKLAKARVTYNVLALDEDLTILEDPECAEVEIDQFKGDDLEVWKTREDGMHFVYCNRMEIGYWVIPSHVTILN